MTQITDAERKYWDEWNLTYRDRDRNRELDEVPLDEARVILGWLADLRGHRADLRILEVGCGTGWLSERASRYGRVMGVDLSPAAIDEARHRLSGADFFVADILDGELPEGSFDAILTMDTMVHVTDQEAFMRELARLLAPGGQILMSAQNADVLLKHAHVEPLPDGIRRNWPTRERMHYLAGLAGTVVEERTVTPLGDASWRRVLTSKKLRRALGPLGDPWRRQLERMGWGRSIMTRIQG